jgi:hypothetical protein
MTAPSPIRAREGEPFSPTSQQNLLKLPHTKEGEIDYQSVAVLNDLPCYNYYYTAPETMY